MEQMFWNGLCVEKMCWCVLCHVDPNKLRQASLQNRAATGSELQTPCVMVLQWCQLPVSRWMREKEFWELGYACG